MLKQFNKLIYETVINSVDYNFRHDEENNIFCDFKIKEDDNEIIVNAKKFNDVLTFVLTDKDGKSETLSQKEFSVKYFNEFNKFEKLLKRYEEDDLKNDKESAEDSPINQMNDVLDKEEKSDETIKFEKDITVNNTIFNFKILEDLAIENYCQCIFEIFDKEKNKKFGFKCLIFIKEANSLIVKIIEQNDKGENMMMLTEEDFKNDFPQDYQNLKEAIVKISEYFYNRI